MAIKFHIGDAVRQVVPVIEGTVIAIAIIDADVAFEVTYTVGGEQHSRFFTGDELEAAAAP